MSQTKFRKAQALVLTALRHNGPLKSHVLTELCRRLGLIQSSQTGALFSSLQQRDLIAPYAHYRRLNGQLDGIVWAATGFYPRLTLLVEPRFVGKCELECGQ